MTKTVIDDCMAVPARRGTSYPLPLASQLQGRTKRMLTEQLNLTQFGVNLTTLDPGGISSFRHWHEVEDEMVYVLSGEVTLVTDEGARALTAGMAAGFPAGRRDGHHLVNRSSAPATFLEVGTRAKEDRVSYPDVDLKAEKHAGQWHFTNKGGTPYA